MENLGKWAVLEHSCHGTTLGLLRGCCPGRKPESLGVLGVSWAQFGFVQASTVISVLMEGPAHSYQQGLCTQFHSWAWWWGSSASRKALKCFPETKDLHAVCLPTPDTSPASCVAAFPLPAVQPRIVQAGETPHKTQCCDELCDHRGAAATETTGMAQGFDLLLLRTHP